MGFAHPSSLANSQPAVGKLVRDRIPKIIRAQGGQPVVETATRCTIPSVSYIRRGRR